jgi:hypothetical protein
MKRLLEILAGAAAVVLAVPLLLGICISVGSGILEATRLADVVEWYKQGAQIPPYDTTVQYDCPDPDLYCAHKNWWEQDLISLLGHKLTHLQYEAGLQNGPSLWNVAMSNGLVRIAVPIILTAFIGAIAKKILDKAWV